MALSFEEFQAQRRSGMTVEQIAASGRGAQPDTTGQLAPLGPTNPFAGVAGGASSAVNAVGGLKGVAAIGGVGASLYGGKKILDRMTQRGAPPPPTVAPPDATMPPPAVDAPPPMPQAPPDKNWHTLTDRDVARIPAFNNFEPGDPIRRTTYENAVMKSAQEPKGRGASPPSSYQRQGNPTRPITVDNEPARAPAPTPESPGAGRGASGPELARRAASRAKSVGRASAPADAVDTAESVKAAPRASEAGQRHSIPYTSQSRKTKEGLPVRLDIEDMNTTHLKNAHARMAAELKDAKTPSPVKMAEFKAINAEIKHRATTQPGLTAYKSPVKGDLARQRTELAELLGEDVGKIAGKAGRAGKLAKGLGKAGPVAGILAAILSTAMASKASAGTKDSDKENSLGEGFMQFDPNYFSDPVTQNLFEIDKLKKQNPTKGSYGLGKYLADEMPSVVREIDKLKRRAAR